MKKLVLLLIAVQISALAFASRNVVPSDAVLAAYYNPGEVCMCFFVPDELNCNTIVVTGSFNSWSSTIADCATVEPVTGYDGWYVSSFVPEAQPSDYGGIQAKPIMLDADTNFNWEYQVGAATIIRGGVQITSGGVANEIDLYNYGTDAPNVFTVDAWKQNPCTATYHDYTITVISDGCNGLAVPFIVGAITNWAFQQIPLDQAKTAAYQTPTYSYSFRATEGLPYQIVSGLKDLATGEIAPDAMPGWEDIAYMQKFINDDDVWVRMPGDAGENLLTQGNANIVFDLRTDTLRWARCASESTDPVINYDHVQIGDLYYNLDVANHTAEATSQNETYPFWTTDITTVNIPSTVTYNNVTYRVTSIGYSAFRFCSLTSLTIPNSVTRIGNYAFSECSTLTSVTIPDGVTHIGGWAFYFCRALTSVTILNSITTIEVEAFRDCNLLNSVTIGTGVTSIESGAFIWCSGLTSITCKAVNPPAMGGNVFEDVNKSIPLYVPAQSINAYRNAEEWNEFTNIQAMDPDPEPVSYSHVQIDGLFYNLDAANHTAEVTSQNSDYPYWTTNITTAHIPTSVTYNDVTYRVTSIEEAAFRKCNALTAVTIPNSVTSMGMSAFAECRGLNSLTIGTGITRIEEATFEYCTSLTTVAIPDNVTFIGEEAFRDCNSLITLAIGSGITSIGQGAFRMCSALTLIACNAVNPPAMGGNVFEDVNKSMPLYVPTQSINAYRTANEWSEFTNIKDINAEPGPVSGDRVQIGDLYYILDATNRTAEVTSQIGSTPYWTFEITTANIPSTVTYNNVTYRVTSIGHNAFHYCDYLTSVTIPNSVTSIGEEAFYRCIALTSVTIPNSVTSLGDYVFWSCSGLTSISIPNSITSISNHAFRACSSLTSITLPNSITSIGESAFRECYQLTSITIPNSVTSMGESVFRDCFQLTSITIPSSVTSISAYAFSGCSHMTSVTIPNSVTSIGERAFDNSRRLTSITCKALNPPALGGNVFISVDKSIPLYVPAQSINAYRAADQWNEFTNIQAISSNPDPDPDPDPKPEENDYNVIYQISDGFQLDAEIVTLHLPVAPQIAGFSFLKWQVVAGDLVNGIKIQAVYTAKSENTPEVVINPANSAQKLIRNGQVYILTEDKIYSITGQTVR